MYMRNMHKDDIVSIVEPVNKAVTNKLAVNH